MAKERCVDALDQDRERGLGAEVQRTKDALLAMLTEKERKSHRRTTTDGRGYPWTFEDSVGQIIKADSEDPRKAVVAEAYRLYQHAINAMWIYVHSSGAIERLYLLWRSKWKTPASLVTREDAEAEIIFRIRDVIRKWDPAQGARFLSFAGLVLLQELNDWARSETTMVHRPREVLRDGSTLGDIPYRTADTKLGQEDLDSTDLHKSNDKVKRQRSTSASYAPDEEALLELIDTDKQTRRAASEPR